MDDKDRGATEKAQAEAERLRQIEKVETEVERRKAVDDEGHQLIPTDDVPE